MATSTISKRSLRLNTHDLSTKVSYKTLRSRKIITVNERSLKTNTATRSKKLHVVAENISLRKHESIKSNNNYSHDKLNKKKKVGKSTKKEQEKRETRNKKRNVVISSSINKNKHRVSIKEKKVTNRLTEQRQMSLQESFKRQSLVKSLRPRRNKVNYCDDSKLLQQHLPSQHQDSIVMVERMCTDDINIKVPVYKTIKTSEQSSENTNDVYDFKYDSEDRREKLAKKKKKKKTIQVKSRIIKKRVQKKVTVETKLVNNDEANKSSDPNTDPPIEIVQHKSPLESVAIPPPLPESTKEYALEIIEEPKVDTDIQTIEQIPPSDKESAEQTKKPDIKKPRILSVENVTNITITKAPPGSAKDILPFRASSNIFNKRPTLQYRNLLNSSLLIKSLSPISKEHDTFDPGSPWRPPQLPYVFSQAKHFIQSTPNETKKDTIHKKLLQIKGDSHNADKVANVSDIVLKNINFSLQNLSDNKVGHKKNSNVYRKFGTEITNIEYLNNCTTIQDNNVEVVSEKPVTETEANSVTNVQLNKIAITSPNSASFDDTDDKENVATNYQTPRKSMKKKLKKRHLSNLSPFKAHEIKSIAPSENVDPQPGPSGIAASKNEQRILRQSNLNNFLNLMDMPENTRINTKHGIFNDAHSSPVNSSAIKKPSKPAMGELENAFGFCDDDAELSTSPTKDESATDPASTKVQATCATKSAITPAPVRLSLRELRNNLLQKKPNKNAGGQQMKKQQIVEVSKPPEVEKNNRLVNITNFSDTFDVLSESEKPSNCEDDIPLFVDLEPSHFTMPPQHSYKRKRAVMFHFSDNSGNEEDEKEIKTHAKKKKFTKLDKENKKRLDEWVKTVNNTFQEIDEYDLLIE
ncbi:uncharacterized protein LOC116848648 [Odontomachus brunneus]|uniref:uncharacterized protein LOC116848648 n=1 Tax=Odontomachus brunneus TaxID=486640 RepID=UPI0013F1B0A6|nr:uncharacterized protein LOC116848648 [Odontomachus brunneus]XP_032680847.1 uncharacterized protein LOC116848648 [Odontomachus brunneus]XP_032680848.1 uncharacterized protein LOC116848648 [Odontomachus brunneus]